MSLFPPFRKNAKLIVNSSSQHWSHRHIKHHAKSLSLPGPLHQPGHGAEALLRPHAAPRHLSALLWWQLQRHPQEVPQHGGQSVWLPLDGRRATRASGRRLLSAAGETLEVDNKVSNKPHVCREFKRRGRGGAVETPLSSFRVALEVVIASSGWTNTHTCAFYCIYKTLKAVTFVPFISYCHSLSFNCRIFVCAFM